MRRNDIADNKCDAQPLAECEARNLNALAAHVPESRLLFAPYEHTLYSNLGYALLGQACARAAGVPYETYIQTRILNRLGMHSTACQIFAGFCFTLNALYFMASHSFAFLCNARRGSTIIPSRWPTGTSRPAAPARRREAP